MSEATIRLIQFNQDFGVYLTGDSIEVTYDPDLNPTPIDNGTIGFEAYHVRDGIRIDTASQFIPSIDDGLTQESITQFQYCLDGDLVEAIPFGTTYPFAYTQVTENSYSCLDPIVCDLVTTIATVYPATGPDSADASVVINATSTYDLQYKIGSDFTYNDGTGNISNTFNDLLPGSYRFFIRDFRNCSANILVVVGFDNTFSPKYRLQYDDIAGRVTTIDISGRTFEGSVTEVCGSGDPVKVSLRGEGEADKFKSIVSTQISVTLLATYDGQFDDLYTDDPEEYRVYYYKNGDLKGVYKILPNQLQKEYKNRNYYVTFIAVDGSAELSQLPYFKDDNSPFYGQMKAIELIAYILRKTKLNINIRVAVNIFADDMDEDGDPLDQTYVDLSRYYLNETEPDLMYVLKAIFDSFNARLICWEGRWNIMRMTEMVTDFDYRDFDAYGVLTGSGIDNRVDSIESPVVNINMLANANHNVEIIPAYGKVRLTYDLGLRPNIITNGDFSLKSVYNTTTGKYDLQANTDGFTFVSPYAISKTGYSALSSNDLFIQNIALVYQALYGETVTGEAYILAQLEGIKVGANDTMVFTITVGVPPYIESLNFNKTAPYVKVRFSVRYYEIFGLGGEFWLTQDGSWSTTENIVTYYVTTFNTFIDIQIRAKQPHEFAGTEGGRIDVKLYHVYPFQVDYADITEAKTIPTLDVHDAPVGTKIEILQSHTDLYDGELGYYYYELEQSTDAEDIPFSFKPDDYDIVNNPHQWILKDSVLYEPTNLGFFQIDKIQLYIPSYKYIIRDKTGQPRNKYLYEKTVLHGFSTDIINTLRKDYQAQNIYYTANVVAFETIMSGYFRDQDGNGYEVWHRKGIEEETSLHAILLDEITGQVNKSLKLFTGDFFCKGEAGLLSVFKLVSDNNTKYLPMSIEINDKMSIYSVSMIEIVDIYDYPTAPFSPGFSTGFGGGFDA